jgi:hypothetical protein
MASIDENDAVVGVVDEAFEDGVEGRGAARSIQASDPMTSATWRRM